MSESNEVKKRKRGRPKKQVRVLDEYAGKFGFVQKEMLRQQEFHPSSQGMSIEEYLNDYVPSGMERDYGKSGVEDKKAGRPRKNIRSRISGYLQTETDRLRQVMVEQDGTEYNVLRDLVAQSADAFDGKEKKNGVKSRRTNAFTNDAPRVSGMTNMYEFQGRMMVMERMIELEQGADRYGKEDVEYIRLLWWYCKKSIEDARRAWDNLRNVGYSVETLFQKERRLYGMVNQFERVRNRIRHVVVSTDLDFENIREQSPETGLLEYMKEEQKQEES